jgi:hypothetical protein
MLMDQSFSSFFLLCGAKELHHDIGLNDTADIAKRVHHLQRDCRVGCISVVELTKVLVIIDRLTSCLSKLIPPGLEHMTLVACPSTTRSWHESNSSDYGQRYTGPVTLVRARAINIGQHATGTPWLALRVDRFSGGHGELDFNGILLGLDGPAPLPSFPAGTPRRLDDADTLFGTTTEDPRLAPIGVLLSDITEGMGFDFPQFPEAPSTSNIARRGFALRATLT